ncbi:MAG: hypothetical protein IKH16_03170 [Selenomonadaceae bacterium]|nr:hypothetical protein [Selenomonadaceae bacterium]
MRRILVGGTAMLFALSSFLLLPGEGQEDGIRTAEASATIRVANRELKRNKRPPTQTDIYERAHRIIWSGGKSYDDRVRIAVVINGDENIIVEDRVKNQVYSQLRNKFPRENFAVMKGTDVNTKLLQYAEDQYFDERGRVTVTASSEGHSLHRTNTGVVSSVIGGVADFLVGSQRAGDHKSTVTYSKSERLDVDGVPVGMRPRGISDLRREDFVRAGRDLGYDYVFILTLTNGEADNYKHNYIVLNSITNHKNIWMRVRFVDVDNNSYIYRNDLVAQGKTHNGGFNGKIFERAVANAVQEAMDDIAIDY